MVNIIKYKVINKIQGDKYNKIKCLKNKKNKTICEYL